MDDTPEQHDAIHTHDRNLIVTAGAGSGKTRVLVDRFIALLEAFPDWRLPALVAITFTEKAAREMRDRVRQAIEQRIERATDADDSDAIRRWRDHQAALDSARIGTIHGLCASILRANAAEVEIDPAFTVLDEIEASILRTQAVEETLARLADENPRVARLLIDYDVNTVQSTLARLITLRRDQLPDPAVPYLEQWRKAYEQNAASTFDWLRNDGEFIEALNWQPQSDWPKADKLMLAWELVIANRDAALDPQTPADILLAILQRWSTEIKLNTGSASAWGGKDGLAAAKEHLKVIRACAQWACEEVRPFGDADVQAADTLLLWGEAIAAAQAMYKALKGRRQLDFDDLEALTRVLLRDPAVAARYQGAEFRHILVDEFQDTNEAQREIVEALAGMDRAGSLFVVGDPRQSIYQFRGADVSVFGKVQEKILAAGGREIALSTSFRTHRQLVDAFNVIFSKLMQRGSGPNAQYEVELGQPMNAIRDAHDALCLELILIDKDKDDPANADELRQREASELARRLSELARQGWPIWDKEKREHRPVGYGDMAVLFQSSRGMPMVEEAFKAAEIPYVTVGGKGYYGRPEVWDLLNLLKALYNPADNLALASALRSPLYNLSDDDLFALRLQRTPPDPLVAADRGERLPLWSALTDPEVVYDPPLPDAARIEFARASLLRLRVAAGRVPISELLVRALEETAYLATLSGLPDGARRCGNVEKLIEVARRSGRISLGEFTLYLDDLTEREVREGEALVAAQGAVQLMTVHASKGLEFPLVALFDSSWEGGGSDSTLIVDPVIGPVCSVRDSDGEKLDPFAFRLAKRYADERDAAERIRLLYVAMTRAQDYVIVSGRTNGKGPWLRKLIDALAVPESAGTNEPELLQYDWGHCLIRRTITPASAAKGDSRSARSAADRRESAVWDELYAGPVAGVAAKAPPLLARPEIDQRAQTRTMNASEIGLLGEAKADGRLDRFRHLVLRDTPTSIREVARQANRVSGRIIGDMVHRALRWGYLPDLTPNLRQILDSYAWQEGLTDPKLVEDAIGEATKLLTNAQKSSMIMEMLDSLEKGRQVYRELPFSFQFGSRTINGVIDALFFSKYQRWHVIDYKTSVVPAGPETNFSERIHEHATRYYAQIGVYAAAVRAMTGQTPDTHLYYIRHSFMVNVEQAAWKAVLDGLNGEIDAALGE